MGTLPQEKNRVFFADDNAVTLQLQKTVDLGRNLRQC
jgi:hypothetical protein